MKKVLAIVISMCLLISLMIVDVSAKETVNVYYLGKAVNAGKDTGYSGNSTISIDDPHYGWELGSFYFNGYTRSVDEDTDSHVFLKNF